MLNHTHFKQTQQNRIEAQQTQPKTEFRLTGLVILVGSVYLPYRTEITGLWNGLTINIVYNNIPAMLFIPATIVNLFLTRCLSLKASSILKTPENPINYLSERHKATSLRDVFLIFLQHSCVSAE